MAGEYIDTTFMDGFVDGPHITEVQTGLANQGLYGPEDYVLEGGREAEAQVLTNNSIRIFDAVYVIQGRRDVIAANDYTDVSIDNGAQEMNRNDIIVRRYTKDESTEIENTEYAVIKGTPVSGEAVDPEVTEGDIRSGATQHDMKLYRVRLEGLNIVAVEPLFKVLYNAETIKGKLDELNENNSVHVFENRFRTGIISRIGNTKMLILDTAYGSFKSGQRYTLGTLAPEYCPLSQIEKFCVIAANENNTYTARLIITTAGVVYFTPYTDRPQDSAIFISETYI